MKTRKLIKKIRQLSNSMQWQLTGAIMLASVSVCLIIMAVRMINVGRNFSDVTSSSVIAGAANQLRTNPWFFNADSKRFTEVKPVASPEERPEATQAPDLNISLNQGSIFQEMNVDFRFFPPENAWLYYIDANEQFYPIRIGRGFDPKHDDVQDTRQAEIRQIGLNLLETIDDSSQYGQLIITENDYSVALITHEDKKNKTKGFYYLYVTDPDVSKMMRAMLASSMKESFGLLVFSLILGLIIGFIFSNRWTKWFANTSSVLNRWSEGDLSQRIENSDGMTISEWHNMADKLNDMADQLEQVVETRKDLAASEERNRIARELHDSIKQQLFSVSMNLGAAQVLFGKKPEQAIEKVGLASELTRSTLLELDVLIGAMRPVVTSDKHLAKELKKYCENWQQSSEIELTTEIEDVSKLTDKEISAELLRICQEALSNIMRHSGAKKAELKISVDEIGVRVIIKDNGHGFDNTQRTTGIGLQSINERVSAMNGAVSIQSNESGTVIKAYMPQKMRV